MVFSSSFNLITWSGLPLCGICVELADLTGVCTRIISKCNPLKSYIVDLNDVNTRKVIEL